MAAAMEKKKLEALPLFMLQSLCKAKGKPQKGSKPELIDRLLAIKKQKPLPSGGKLGLGVVDEEDAVGAGRQAFVGGEAYFREVRGAEIEPKASAVTDSEVVERNSFMDSSQSEPPSKKFKLAQKWTGTRWREVQVPVGEDEHKASAVTGSGVVERNSFLDSSQSETLSKESIVAQSWTSNFVMPELPANFAMPSSSKVSAAGFDHRPLPEFRVARCVHCSALFNLQKARCASTKNFWCPSCRFKVMDPFNEVVPGNGLLHCALVTGAHMQFTLDTPELKQWQDNKDSVEVRMLRVDSERICHVWPKEIEVKANGDRLFKILPPDPQQTRRDVAQDIVSGLRSGINTIEVEMADDDAPLTDFVFAVVHAKACSVGGVCSRVGKCEEADARERVCELRKKSFEDAGTAEDMVECLSTDVLKLICPITMDRVVQPARGRQCQHLQCFGLRAYCKSNFAMSAHHNRWVCPLCAKTLRPIDLCVDEYVERIVRETQEQALEEVTIALDGSWKARAVADGAAAVPAPGKAKLTGTPLSTSR